MNIWYEFIIIREKKKQISWHVIFVFLFLRHTVHWSVYKVITLHIYAKLELEDTNNL